MSLGKLLTTGKSLVGLSHGNGRYQLQKGALPKFESAKNPFASKTHAESAEREPQLPKLAVEELKAITPTAPKKTDRLPALAALIADREASVAASRSAQPMESKQVSAPKQESPAPAPQVAAPVDSWLKKINPMVWFGNRKPAEPKPAIPRFSKAKTPIQGELSLDNIKVMRNDLSEADVEVVPAKARAPKVVPAAPVQASAAAAMAIPDLPPARAAWEILGEHLMGRR